MSKTIYTNKYNYPEIVYDAIANDDYDYTEEYCSNEKNNKIKFIFISIIIFLIVVFLISKYTMIL